MREPGDTEVARWFERRTLPPYRGDPRRLADMKSAAHQRISVCLPALNEERTIGEICCAVRSAWMGSTGLVDELVVMDSGSEDATVAEAERAGADVYRAADLLPDLEPATGKGEALWKSLAVLTGDVIVWLDSDVSDFDPAFVPNLVAPLLSDPSVAIAKGFYERPAGGEPRESGGRITELTARPLLNLLWPSLSGMIQPLAGEYAVRRETAIRLPFFSGYAVDVGLLIDCAETLGLDSIAQVDLGRRIHRRRDTLALGRAAHEIARALLIRAAEAGRLGIPQELPKSFVQFFRRTDGVKAVKTEPVSLIRPPMAAVLGEMIGHNG